jgi:hypothetical protein
MLLTVVGRTKEGHAMKEDVVLVTGVILSAAICGWYMFQAVSGVAHPIPTDDTCPTVTQCLAIVMAP